LLAGLSIAAPIAAAAYPAPFVVGGNADVAIVYGANANTLDAVEAGFIQSDLQAVMGGLSGTTTATVTGGDAKSLASGSDLLYLNDEFNENVATLTKADLTTVLADGTFTDDDGTTYDYEQTLSVGSHADNHFAFSNSDNDLTEPTTILEISDSAANEIYKLTATFNKAVNLSAADSEGEEIVLFGKTYTIGTSSDTDTLVLLGGADSSIIQVGETKTLTVNGKTYDITLLGLSSASTTEAQITVNGESKTFTQGQTKTFTGGLDLYAKTVFRTGDSGTGHVEVQLGADRLTLENGSAVMYGNDNDDIEGTLVTFTPASGSYTEATTAIAIEVAAKDNDENHILVGESFVDPVFGTLKVNFAGVVNGPTIVSHKDTGRTNLEIVKGGNEELNLLITDKGGNTATIPFAYQSAIQNDNNETIKLVEGTAVSQEDYLILNSGDNQHFMKVTKITMAATAANSDVQLKDQITGDVYAFDNHDFSDGYSATILGQTYTITNTSSTAVTITSSDFATNLAVFPYIELVSGKDTRVALTQDTAIAGTITPAAADTSSTASKIYELPTGSIQFNVTNGSAAVTDDKYRIDSGTWTAIEFEDDTYAIGSVDYVINTTWTLNTSLVIDYISLEASQTAGADIQELDPAILFVEHEDKSETTTTTKNAVVVSTVWSGGYGTVNSPVFTSTGYDTETFDDSEFVGWLTNYGTYIWKDSGDTNQDFVGLSYPTDIMYAEVYIAENGAVITGGSTPGSTPLGEVVVTDSEIAQVSSKNLIIVGGSCINSAAATVFGGAYCGPDFTTNTGIGAGEYIIKSASGAFTAGKLALVVAGYNVADTVNGAKYLRNQNPDTSQSWKGTTAVSATAVVEGA